MSEYSEKLKDPRWQKKRLEIFKRDGWACSVCGSTTKTLNIHHKKYCNSNPWESDDKDIETVCEDCHETEHIKKIFKELARIGVVLEFFVDVMVGNEGDEDSNGECLKLTKKLSNFLKKDRVKTVEVLRSLGVKESGQK